MGLSIKSLSVHTQGVFSDVPGHQPYDIFGLLSKMYIHGHKIGHLFGGGWTGENNGHHIPPEVIESSGTQPQLVYEPEQRAGNLDFLYERCLVFLLYPQYPAYLQASIKVTFPLSFSTTRP